jgi:transcriptional regulator with XRE-family HTH domain
MGTLQSKKGSRENGARRFEPSSEAKAGPVLTKVGESRRSAPAEREKLGRLVAARRAELGLTHRDLATRMDVSRATIARIEKGQPQSTETLRRLAKALRPEKGTELQRSLEAELVLRGVVAGSLATSGALDRLRPSMPHVSVPKVSAPKISLPKISMPKVSIPRVSLPRPSLEPVNRRWLLSAVGAVALIALVAIVAMASSGDGGGDDPAPQAAPVLSASPLASPAPEPRKATEPKKANKADEKTAAPVADSEESSSSDEASFSDEPSSDGDSDGGDGPSEPPSTPVATPAPPPSGGQGGGGGSGRPPGILHGIDPGVTP